MGETKSFSIQPYKRCVDVQGIKMCLSDMQFKFVVDGEWRNDEQQPIMTDPAGLCSNYVVVREVESGSTSRGVGRGNMDVEDGDVHVGNLKHINIVCIFICY